MQISIAPELARLLDRRCQQPEKLELMWQQAHQAIEQERQTQRELERQTQREMERQQQRRMQIQSTRSKGFGCLFNGRRILAP